MRSEVTSARWIPGIWLLTILALAHLSISSAPAAEPAWKLLEEEAVALLRRYIRIDTSNPPGNETKAAAFFKEIFDRENIEARIIESAPGRGNISAKSRGGGSQKAVVLLNHLDVVPAAARFWREPPFGGAVKDGFIWVRGSQDMKGAAIHGNDERISIQKIGFGVLAMYELARKLAAE